MPSPDMRRRHVLMYERQAFFNTGTHGQETAPRDRAKRPPQETAPRPP